MITALYYLDIEVKNMNTYHICKQIRNNTAMVKILDILDVLFLILRNKSRKIILKGEKRLHLHSMDLTTLIFSSIETFKTVFVVVVVVVVVDCS